MRQFGKKVPGVSYVERPGAYAVIVNDKEELAMIKTPRGHFLLGGGIDPGEEAKSALAREVLEETGMSTKVLEYLGTASQYIYSPEDKQGFNKIGEFYAAELLQPVAQAIEKDHELVWLGFEEAMARLNHEYQKWAIQLVISGPRRRR